jgi:NAD(P)-dependent dehydrogenase (short-subunit alcohol dehydrogenase family)
VNYFITGGSRGLGAAIVHQAVREGHDVAFTFRKGEAEAHAVMAEAKKINPERKVRAYRMDVGSSTDVEEVGNRVLDDFDSVEVVVANAGINVNNLVANMTDDEWDAVIRTNLTGAFYTARQFLPAMVGNRFGRLIFMSSLGAGGVSGQANYSASKAGLLGLSSAIAKEYGRKGITSNCIVAGFFDTDMTREGMSSANRTFWLQYCPQGRIGDASEAAKAVTFLASDAASFINGQALPINGGLDWAP